MSAILDNIIAGAASGAGTAVGSYLATRYAIGKLEKHIGKEAKP